MIELERLKREMRGIPPLSAHKLTELMKRARPGALSARCEPRELDIEATTENEDSPEPPTVTAPPTVAGERLCSTR